MEILLLGQSLLAMFRLLLNGVSKALPKAFLKKQTNQQTHQKLTSTVIYGIALGIFHFPPSTDAESHDDSNAAMDQIYAY